MANENFVVHTGLVAGQSTIDAATGNIVTGGSVRAQSVYTDNLRFANGSPFVSTTVANSAEIVANISSGTNVGLTLTTTGVVAGNYGSATSIPTIVVDGKGRVTSLTTNAVSTTIGLTGTTGTGSVAGGGSLTFAATNGIAINASGSTLTISTPQDLRTTASPTFNAITASGAVQINNSLAATGAVTFSNPTASTSSSTGALVVAGGLGVAGEIYTSNIYASNVNVTNTNSTSVYAGTVLTNNLQFANGSPYVTTTLANSADITANAASGTNVGLTLTTTGVVAGNYGSATSIPTIVVDNKGRVSSITTNAVSTTIGIVGTTGSGSISGGQSLTFSSLNGVVIASAGQTLSISSPQDLRSTASPQFSAITINGSAQVNGTLSASGVTSITNSTPSTGASNGALVVTGGLGVGGSANFGTDVYVTGNLYVSNLVATSSSTLNTSSPMVYFDVTPVYPYNFDTGFYSHFVGGPANVYAHMGMVRNYASNHWTFFSNVSSEPSSTTINFADPGIIYDTIRAGGMWLSNTTPSLGVNTGALVVDGGVGINGNLSVNNVGYFGYQASLTNLVNPTLISTASSASVNVNALYVQTAVINGAGTGSADMIAYPNNSDGNTGFVDVGVTGNIFADPLYTITGSNDGYLFVSAPAGANKGGNLVLATDSTGSFNDIVVGVGSFYANSEVARFRGNASTGGYLQLSHGTAATSTSTGALRVAGGAGITGSMYAGSVFDSGTRVLRSVTITAGSGMSGGGTITNGTGTVTLTNSGVIGITTGTGISANVSTGTVQLTNTGVTSAVAGTGIGISASTGEVTITNAGVTGLSSSGSGNLTVSASTGAVAVTLPTTGPGATTIGGSSSIPVITVDAYGRVTALSSASVASSGFSIAGTSGTGSVSGGGTLTFATSNGVTLSASGSTVTVSTPQDVRTTASPTFNGLSVTSATRGNKTLITNFSSTSAPSNPQQGDEWYKTDTGVMYKYIYDGTSYVWVNVSSALFNASTSATANTLALRDGSGNLTATNFNGVASSAKYADLAEVYVADQDYEPGTVVVFGGIQEITTTSFSHDTRVAGVISTNPAYLMNSEAVGLPVALTGRVPCKVKGFVKKGDILVTSSVPGVAQKMSDDWYKPGCIIGKAISENKTSGIATIEVVVGRF